MLQQKGSKPAGAAESFAAIAATPPELLCHRAGLHSPWGTTSRRVTTGHVMQRAGLVTCNAGMLRTCCTRSRRCVAGLPWHRAVLTKGRHGPQAAGGGGGDGAAPGPGFPRGQVHS